MTMVISMRTKCCSFFFAFNEEESENAASNRTTTSFTAAPITWNKPQQITIETHLQLILNGYHTFPDGASGKEKLAINQIAVLEAQQEKTFKKEKRRPRQGPEAQTAECCLKTWFVREAGKFPHWRVSSLWGVTPETSEAPNFSESRDTFLDLGTDPRTWVIHVSQNLTNVKHFFQP